MPRRRRRPVRGSPHRPTVPVSYGRLFFSFHGELPVVVFLSCHCRLRFGLCAFQLWPRVSVWVNHRISLVVRDSTACRPGDGRRRVDCRDMKRSVSVVVAWRKSGMHHFILGVVHAGGPAEKRDRRVAICRWAVGWTWEKLESVIRDSTWHLHPLPLQPHEKT